MARDDAATWSLIHRERADAAELIDGLSAEQLATPSLCAGWNVHTAAAHILTGAEQTPRNFFAHMLRNGMNFDKMIDRDARAGAALPIAEIATRLRARTTTTNKAPAPTVTMLGEVVAHTEDIRRPLGLPSAAQPESLAACLDYFVNAGFPLGSKARAKGLRLEASDIGWTHGDGPPVTGPAMTLIMALTGRPIELNDLTGEGVATLQSRLPAR